MPARGAPARPGPRIAATPRGAKHSRRKSPPWPRAVPKGEHGRLEETARAEVAQRPSTCEWRQQLDSSWAILEDQIAIGMSGKNLLEEPARPVPADRLLAGVAGHLPGLYGYVTREKVGETAPPRVLGRTKNSLAPASPALTLARRRPRRSRSGA
jgi:hypothetical protein